jgi:aminopeptidase-like protein
MLFSVYKGFFITKLLVPSCNFNDCVMQQNQHRLDLLKRDILEKFLIHRNLTSIGVQSKLNCHKKLIDLKLAALRSGVTNDFW